MNVFPLIAEKLRSCPQATAIVNFRSLRRTTAEALLSATEDLAQRLRPLLPGEKSIVIICLPNGEDCIATVLALWKLGHAVMPLPTALTNAEIEHVLLNGPAATMIHSPLKEIQIGETTDLGHNVFRRFKADPAPNFPTTELAFVRFTSGTTDQAKGVLISHEAVAQRARSFGAALGLKDGQSVLWHLDMSYHFTTSIVAFLLHSCAIHIGNILLPSRFADWLKENAVDYFFSLPFFYSELMQYNGVLRGDAKLYVTGQSIDANTLLRFREKYRRAIRRMYGIIEVGIPVLDGEDDDPGHLGRLISPYQIQFREDGGMLFKGPGSFYGYLMGPHFDYVPFTDEWFDTGDLGRRDANGEIHLVGRAKEIISLPGIKFFPSEVEGVLNSLTGVRASAVFQSGNTLTAVFESDREISENEFLSHLRRFLEMGKIPTEFRRVEKVPRTTSGKISRKGSA